MKKIKNKKKMQTKQTNKKKPTGKSAFEFRGMRNLERQKDLKQIQEMEFQENSQDSDRWRRK